MEEQEIQALLIKYANGKCTQEEIFLVETAYLNEQISFAPKLSEEEITHDLHEVFLALPKPKRVINYWIRIAAAAAIVFAIGTAWWFYRSQSTDSQNQAVNHYGADVAPGKNSASLTLMSGKTVQLSTKNELVIIGAKSVSYRDRSEVSSVSGRKDEFATITTPRGGTYQMILQDGTHVWLNAESAIKFPVSFEGMKNRDVEIKGEAYFEVAKDKQHPFVVKSIGQEIEVLGTHFNINSYANEQTVKTTLLEGSVKVKPDLHVTSVNKVLVPGEQAILKDHSVEVRKADLTAAVAWKNGEFLFQEDDFEQAMRSISRWYDVDVVYEPNAPRDFELGGFVSRSKNLSSVLTLIEMTGKVHFKIEGRRVFVTK